MNKIQTDIRSLVYNSFNRARNLGISEHFSAQELLDMFNDYGFKCMSCGISGKFSILSVDHICPLSSGGSNTIDNIQILCVSCNCKKHDKTVDYKSCCVKSPWLKHNFDLGFKRKQTMPEGYTPLLVRLPTHLLSTLREEAKKNVRSLNSQLIVLLAERYELSTEPPQETES